MLCSRALSDPNPLHELDSLLHVLRKKQADLVRQLEQVDADIRIAEIKRARIHNDRTFISILPYELLSNIFLISQNSRPSFQITASHVCHNWRQISTGTPLLWANVVIRLEKISHITSSFHKLTSYLNRTSPSTLYAVRMHVRKDIDFSGFLELIASQISRCYLFFIFSSVNTKAWNFLRESFESLHAPQLKHLAIQVKYGSLSSHERTFSDTPLIFKGGIPSLSFLQLTGTAATLRPPICSSVTTLHLDGEHVNLTLSIYREILSSVPYLVNLSLHDIEFPAHEVRDAKTDRLPSLDLPRLRSLRVNGSGHALNALPLKQLEVLVLCEVSKLPSFDFPNVKDLCLYDCPFGVSEIGDLVLGFPSVESWTVWAKSLLYMALGMEEDPVWWPKLRIINVWELELEDVPMLPKLVRARQIKNHPLECMYLDDRSRRRAASIQVLEKLKDLTKIGHLDDCDYLQPWPAGHSMVDHDTFWDVY